MTIFTKAKITKILQDKIQSGEIKNFTMTESYIRIQKSKRTGFTFKFNQIPENVLIRVLSKITPKPCDENIEIFFRKEIKRYIK